MLSPTALVHSSVSKPTQSKGKKQCPFCQGSHSGTPYVRYLLVTLNAGSTSADENITLACVPMISNRLTPLPQTNLAL